MSIRNIIMSAAGADQEQYWYSTMNTSGVYFPAIAITNDNNLVLGGSYLSLYVIGKNTGTQISASYGSIAGSKMWSGIAVDASGNIYAAGTTLATTNKLLINKYTPTLGLTAQYILTTATDLLGARLAFNGTDVIIAATYVNATYAYEGYCHLNSSFTHIRTPVLYETGLSTFCNNVAVQSSIFTAGRQNGNAFINSRLAADGTIAFKSKLSIAEPVSGLAVYGVATVKVDAGITGVYLVSVATSTGAITQQKRLYDGTTIFDKETTSPSIMYKKSTICGNPASYNSYSVASGGGALYLIKANILLDIAWQRKIVFTGKNLVAYSIVMSSDEKFVYITGVNTTDDDIFNIKMPCDGSLIGTFGSIVISASTLTVEASSLTVSAAGTAMTITPTVATNTDTYSNSSIWTVTPTNLN